MLLRKIARISTFMGLLVSAAPSYAAFGELWNYVSQFQVGIDYSNSIDHVDLSYETTALDYVPASCAVSEAGPRVKRCSVGMVGGASNGWGVFLERAFKKKGLFYLDWDLSVGTRFLTGELPGDQKSLDGLPLRRAGFSLVAFVMKPYLQLGVTPDFWPDVLISMGPAVQFAAGNVTINDDVANVAVGTSSVTGPMSIINGFFALEIVLKRFGEGSFSLIASQDVTGHGQGSEFFPRDVDGMSNFKGTFQHSTSGLAYGFGLKLVTPFP